MKLLCVLLPHFPLQCETGRQPQIKNQAAAVVYSAGAQKLLLDFSPGLKGLERDMPLQQAVALYGDIRFIPADIPHYWNVFNGVLDALELKSPLVEGPTLGDIFIGCDGLEGLYPGDGALAAAVRSALPEVYEAGMGIGGGKFAAYLAALHGPPGGYRALTGDISGFLTGLSCDLLPVALKTKNSLHEYGLHTLGQVSALNLPQLQAQFGPEGQRIWHLCRGEDDTPLNPRLSEEVIEESTMLASATVSLDVLAMTIDSLLARTMNRIGNRGLGIRCVRLWTRTWLGEYWEQHVHFKEPATGSKTLMARIRHVMENCQQPGPVEQLGVAVTRLSRPVGRQESIFTDVRSDDKLLDDIKQMELRFGAPQLYRVKEVEPWSRIPERRYTLTPLGR
ncbi:hypothetical protein ABFB09_02955 [Dehalogenimonas sp. THU2]|uniref:DNA polymerase Y family protein n=1 Tax=Dehalogenimonas sp. THU2 TaxID=3151121 RepID=UPI0032185EB5